MKSATDSSRLSLAAVVLYGVSHAGLGQERDLSIATFSSLKNIFRNTEGVHLSIILLQGQASVAANYLGIKFRSEKKVQGCKQSWIV